MYTCDADTLEQVRYAGPWSAARRTTSRQGTAPPPSFLSSSRCEA